MKTMNKHRALLAIAALATAPPLTAQAVPSCSGDPATLKAMRDCYRPVLVFAPSAKDPSFIAQQRLIEQYADQMMDRNLLYVPNLARQDRIAAPPHAPYVLLKPQEAEAIRRRFNVGAEDFIVLLVGKDGDEKFRSTRPVSVSKLDALVDAMPMRQQEKAQQPRRGEK